MEQNTLLQRAGHAEQPSKVKNLPCSVISCVESLNDNEIVYASSY